LFLSPASHFRLRQLDCRLRRTPPRLPACPFLQIGATNLPIPFTPISKTSAVDSVHDQLRSAILDGRLEVGERLAPERALAEQFGVGRVTVRGALTRLEAAGLLDVRQGSGYRVRDFRRHGQPSLLGGIADLARDTGDLTAVVADLLLVRRQLAVAVLTRLQGRGPTPELVAAVDAFASALPNGTDAIADADLAILGALLDATGSPVFALCLNPVASTLAELPELRVALYAHPQANLAGWQALLAWLGQPDGDVAALAELLAARDRATLAALEARR
jgi:GntR family transcriptional repressor for pyruvate dehydrogenase complex